MDRVAASRRQIFLATLRPLCRLFVFLSFFLLLIPLPALSQTRDPAPPGSLPPGDGGVQPAAAAPAAQVNEGAGLSGAGGFLLTLPLSRTYSMVEAINSFFDHALPLYGVESTSPVPPELRDGSTQRKMVDFLGDSREHAADNCTSLGVDCYSGHNGVDFNNTTTAQDVVAPATGVIAQGSESGSCLVIIEHDSSAPRDGVADYTTKYMHLSSIANAPAEQLQRPGRSSNPKWIAGDVIHTGEVLGKTGDDPCGGSSKGEHLHFAVYTGGKAASDALRPFDPFGWWSPKADPWADSRLETVTGLSAKPVASRWAWAPPQRDDALWDIQVAAQTDDTDASFHMFGPDGRRGAASKGWQALLPDAGAGIRPLGTGAWLSTSIVDGSSAGTVTQRANWAVWGLYVPADGSYRVDVFLPNLPSRFTATGAAVYTLYGRNAAGGLQTWTMQPLNQAGQNEWRTLQTAQQATFDLQGGSFVLVRLSDATGRAGDAVIFDAVRLRAESEIVPPQVSVQRRVAFAVDNSSSMAESGKMDVLKEALTAWMDRLAALPGVMNSYTMVAFADTLAAYTETGAGDDVKAWVRALDAGDNGAPNTDCPEASLAAIERLGGTVQGGHMLLFTDDFPKDAASRTGSALGKLWGNKVKLHAVLLPKTCYFSGSDYNPAGWLPYGVLTRLTGGTYQRVPADQTTPALNIVLSEMQAPSQLSARNGSAIVRSAAAAADVFPIPVDSSVTKLNVLLNVISGWSVLELQRPDGSTVNAGDPDVNFTVTDSAQYYEIWNPAPGTWQAIVAGDNDYRFSVSADSALSLTYLGASRGAAGEPASIVVRVTGVVQEPTFVLMRSDGMAVSTLSLRDDGRGSDAEAGDGLYSGWYVPTATGEYFVSLTGVAGGEPVQRADSRLLIISGLTVKAPVGQIVVRGDEARLDFVVRNMGSTSETYDLLVSSPNGWISRVPPSRITVRAQQSAVVSVYVTPPEHASPSSLEIIRLLATQRSDNSVVAEDSVYLSTEGVSYGPAETKEELKLYIPYAAR